MRVLAFDLFGTVLDMSPIPEVDLREYGHQIKRDPWQPFVLPSSFELLLSHPDASEGLARLRKHFFVATLSNCPIALQMRLSQRNHLSWNALIPFESAATCKPRDGAYRFAIAYLRLMGIAPGDATFVTANPTFGDVEGAALVGATAQVIRQPGTPKDLVVLAESLGC